MDGRLEVANERGSRDLHVIRYLAFFSLHYEETIIPFSEAKNTQESQENQAHSLRSVTDIMFLSSS